MTVVWVLVMDGLCYGVFREDHKAKAAALNDHGIDGNWQWSDSLQQWRLRDSDKIVVQRELIK